MPTNNPDDNDWPAAWKETVDKLPRTLRDVYEALIQQLRKSPDGSVTPLQLGRHLNPQGAAILDDLATMTESVPFNVPRLARVVGQLRAAGIPTKKTKTTVGIIQQDGARASSQQAEMLARDVELALKEDVFTRVSLLNKRFAMMPPDADGYLLRIHNRQYCLELFLPRLSKQDKRAVEALKQPIGRLAFVNPLRPVEAAGFFQAERGLRSAIQTGIVMTKSGEVLSKEAPRSKLAPDVAAELDIIVLVSDLVERAFCASYGPAKNRPRVQEAYELHEWAQPAQAKVAAFVDIGRNEMLRRMNRLLARAGSEPLPLIASSHDDPAERRSRPFNEIKQKYDELMEHLTALDPRQPRRGKNPSPPAPQHRKSGRKSARTAPGAAARPKSGGKAAPKRPSASTPRKSGRKSARKAPGATVGRKSRRKAAPKVPGAPVRRKSERRSRQNRRRSPSSDAM